jgi:hypothetical protein
MPVLVAFIEEDALEFLVTVKLLSSAVTVAVF